MNVGAFINGTISDNLTDTYPTNTKSGIVDYTFTYTGKTSEYKNQTLNCTLGELNSATTNFYIHATGAQPVRYNFTSNGNKVNQSSTLAIGKGWNWTLASLIARNNVTAAQRYLNFTFSMNNTGNTVVIRIYGTYYKASDFRNTIENNTYSSLSELSSGYDNNINVMIIAAIIAVITIPLAAVVTVKKLM